MIADALAEQGLAVDDDLLPIPVWESAQSYRDAFATLSASRGRNEGGWLAIPYSEIVRCAEASGHADSIDELEEFVRLVQAQDTEFLKHADAARDRMVAR